VLAFGLEDGLTDTLVSNQVYQWQIVAKDARGGQAWSPVWTFHTPVPDADDDGLLDEEEEELGTDVNNPDTDGDGVSDGEEFARGSNPLNRFDRPVLIEAVVPTATLGCPFYGTVRGGYGLPPYRWSVRNGMLPPGLTLTADGAITGTPTMIGRFACQIEVCDFRSDTAAVIVVIDVTPRGDGPAGVVGHGVLGHGAIE
jgi:hypothetical protein